MPRALLLLSLFPVFLATGCAKPPPVAPMPQVERALLIEQRKDALVAQLADCESGTGEGHGSAYVGRLQFTPRTVTAFVKERDGRTISSQEAVAIARDYGRASELAKYMIFERDGYTHWPACSRKLGLAQQVADIKAGV